jgi:hypothetical protein
VCFIMVLVHTTLFRTFPHVIQFFTVIICRVFFSFYFRRLYLYTFLIRSNVDIIFVGGGGGDEESRERRKEKYVSNVTLEAEFFEQQRKKCARLNSSSS